MNAELPTSSNDLRDRTLSTISEQLESLMMRVADDVEPAVSQRRIAERQDRPVLRRQRRTPRRGGLRSGPAAAVDEYEHAPHDARNGTSRPRRPPSSGRPSSRRRPRRSGAPVRDAVTHARTTQQRRPFRHCSTLRPTRSQVSNRTTRSARRWTTRLPSPVRSGSRRKSTRRPRLAIRWRWERVPQRRRQWRELGAGADPGDRRRGADRSARGAQPLHRPEEAPMPCDVGVVRF